MSYPSGNYYSAGRPGTPAGYDAYAWSPERQREAPSPLRYLAIAIAVLGLASYLVSYGLTVPGLGWDVRFAVLAGLIGAFGLLHKQTSTAIVVAALAAAGFLDALSTLINVPDGVQPGWALWVIVVLNGLQGAAAVFALLTQAGVVGEQKAPSWYSTYAEQYAQAAQQYYGQYAAQQAPDASYQHGAGQAQAQQTQQGSAAAQQAATAHQQHAPTSQYGSYADYVGGAEQGASAAPAHGAQPGQHQGAGLPNVGHSQAPAAQQRTEVFQQERRPSQ
jgi:Family of unknown function (DUF5336)